MNKTDQTIGKSWSAIQVILNIAQDSTHYAREKVQLNNNMISKYTFLTMQWQIHVLTRCGLVMPHSTFFFIKDFI